MVPKIIIIIRHGSYPKQDYNIYERKKMDGWMDGYIRCVNCFPKVEGISGLVGAMNEFSLKLLHIFI